MVYPAGRLISEPGADNSARLLIPVIVRAIETGKPDPVLKDETSSEIIKGLDCDLTSLISSINEMRRAAIIASSLCFENIIRNFIRRYPDATLVNLGCGLDTTYERINNSSIHWYDLDSDYVMEIRKLFLSETSNRKFLTSSFIEGKWFKEIIRKDHIMFVANGVFYRYDYEAIKRFFKKLTSFFPLSELTFDVFSTAGVKFVSRLTGKTADDSAVKWGIRNSKEILSWDKHLRFIGKKVIFRHGGLTLTFRDRIPAMISSAFCLWYVLHLRIVPDYRHLSAPL